MSTFKFTQNKFASRQTGEMVAALYDSDPTETKLVYHSLSFLNGCVGKFIQGLLFHFSSFAQWIWHFSYLIYCIIVAAFVNLLARANNFSRSWLASIQRYRIDCTRAWFNARRRLWPCLKIFLLKWREFCPSRCAGFGADAWRHLICVIGGQAYFFSLVHIILMPRICRPARRWQGYKMPSSEFNQLQVMLYRRPSARYNRCLKASSCMLRMR